MEDQRRWSSGSWPRLAVYREPIRGIEQAGKGMAGSNSKPFDRRRAMAGSLRVGFRESRHAQQQAAEKGRPDQRPGHFAAVVRERPAEERAHEPSESTKVAP